MPVDISRELAPSPDVLRLYPFQRTIAFAAGFIAIWATAQGG